MVGQASYKAAEPKGLEVKFDPDARSTEGLESRGSEILEIKQWREIFRNNFEISNDLFDKRGWYNVYLVNQTEKLFRIRLRD